MNYALDGVDTQLLEADPKVARFAEKIGQAAKIAVGQGEGEARMRMMPFGPPPCIHDSIGGLTSFQLPVTGRIVVGRIEDWPLEERRCHLARLQAARRFGADAAASTCSNTPHHMNLRRMELPLSDRTGCGL